MKIRDNLIERIKEAETHRWLREAEMDQITDRRTTTQLGMPTFIQAAGRTNFHPKQTE